MTEKTVKVAVEIRKKEDAYYVPVFQHVTDAGMDICASEDVTLAPGETALVHKSNDVETHVSLDRGRKHL